MSKQAKADNKLIKWNNGRFTRQNQICIYLFLFFIFDFEPKDSLQEVEFFLTSSTFVAFPLEDLIVPEVAVDAELLDSWFSCSLHDHSRYDASFFITFVVPLPSPDEVTQSWVWSAFLFETCIMYQKYCMIKSCS